MLYNITFYVESQSFDSWNDWLFSHFIPSVKKEKEVFEVKTYTVLTAEEPTYSVQIFLVSATITTIEKIVDSELTILSKKFGNSVLFFSSVLQKME